jgi:hypothetical protein
MSYSTQSSDACPSCLQSLKGERSVNFLTNVAYHHKKKPKKKIHNFWRHENLCKKWSITTPVLSSFYNHAYEWQCRKCSQKEDTMSLLNKTIVFCEEKKVQVQNCTALDTDKYLRAEFFKLYMYLARKILKKYTDLKIANQTHFDACLVLEYLIHHREISPKIDAYCLYVRKKLIMCCRKNSSTFIQKYSEESNKYTIICLVHCMKYTMSACYCELAKTHSNLKMDILQNMKIKTLWIMLQTVRHIVDKGKTSQYFKIMDFLMHSIRDKPLHDDKFSTWEFFTHA